MLVEKKILPILNPLVPSTNKRLSIYGKFHIAQLLATSLDVIELKTVEIAMEGGGVDECRKYVEKHETHLDMSKKAHV